MSGHLFVTCGDILNLRCDAWLLPTDIGFNVSDGWGEPAEPHAVPDDWWAVRVRALLGPPVASDPRDTWWVNSGVGHAGSIDWFVNGALEFVERATSKLDGTAPVTERPRPLLAVPLVGSGEGGGAHRAGAILDALLPALKAASTQFDVDIVFVARHQWVFSLAQALRRRYWNTPSDWPDVDPSQAEQAVRLANEAAAGNLVLFLGAGVSASAGLPLWGELVEDVAVHAGVADSELQAFRSLDLLDRARLLELRLNGKAALGRQVADHVKATRYGLCHSLLACLPVQEIVTTNYDTLFELASGDAHHACRVLPYDPSAEQRRWLLKLHGCVTHPDDIVITRDDYLRYADNRAALAGIVQALLVTRHMLFVGFGLADDNFHRIAFAVRTAMGSRPGGRTLGTALQLKVNQLRQELWGKDLAIVAVAAQSSDDKAASRRLEIFLDLLAVHACNGTDYLLDARYTEALTEPESKLRDELQALADSVRPFVSDSSAGRRLTSFLQAMGLDRSEAK